MSCFWGIVFYTKDMILLGSTKSSSEKLDGHPLQIRFNSEFG